MTSLVKPVLTLLSFPFIIVTLGLFLLVINAAMLLLTGWLAEQLDIGFRVDGFWTGGRRRDRHHGHHLGGRRHHRQRRPPVTAPQPGLPGAPDLPEPREPGRYAVALVCLGNICRSPMADVVLAARLDDAGLGDRVDGRQLRHRRLARRADRWTPAPRRR